MKTSPSLAALFVGATLLAIGCQNGPTSEETSQANSNRRSANANAPERLDAPLTANTVSGDVERAALAIGGARQHLRETNWAGALTLLKSAGASVDSALEKKPRTYPEFQDLKAAIERAIRAVESHSNDADNQIAQLEAGIRAIKIKGA